MIHVDPENKLIFVKGVHSLAKIEQEVLAQTDLKKWNWRSYTIVGLADDNSLGLQTALPYQPPPDDRNEVGFKYKGKDQPSPRPDHPGTGKRRKR